MMSSQPSENPSAPSPPATMGTISMASSSSETKSDWLANSLVTARTITAAAECVPFPCVKGVFGTVVVLLETVEKLKKNRDDLKELCENIVEIINVVKRLSVQQDTSAGKLKDRCGEFEILLQAILAAVKKMQTKPKGLRAHFKEIVKLSSTADFSVPQVTQITNNCAAPSRMFHGRQSILHKMQQYFFQTTAKQHIYLVYGLGGAGKTQIVLKFIEESSSHFTNIFFIDTTTVDTIDAGLKNIALEKNVGRTSKDALQWLRNKPDEWLLFFDNADDPKVNLNKFLPQCNHGNILITSRNPELLAYAGAHSLVSDMEASDAVELLLKSAAREITPANRKTAAEIVKVLWYLPLAIIQAGAFILKSGVFDTYLALYATNKERLLREKPVQSHDDYAWTVYTTWQISFDQLSKPAATLLQLCSFLHHEGIPEQIFSYASAYKSKPADPSQEELEKPVEFLSQFLGPTGVWDSFCFRSLISEIRAYSLINLDDGKQLFSIHPLVHEWSRTTLIDQEAYHGHMLAIVGMSISVMPQKNMVLESLRLLPHVDALLHGNMHITPEFQLEYGRIYHYVQNYRQAETINIAELTRRRNILGIDHLETLTVMADLGSAYQNLGKFEEAEKLQLVVLEKRRNMLGEDHRDTQIAMNNLAITYRSLNKWREGEELLVRVVGEQNGLLCDDQLVAMNNLGMTYYSLGKLVEAEAAQVVVLNKRKIDLGEEHPDTLISMNNLATIYGALTRWTEAEELQLTVLEKRRKIMGEDHPETLVAINNLAWTYHGLGKMKEAEDLKVVVLEKRRKILGEDHPHTLTAMHNLASTYYFTGKMQEAEELQVVVLEKSRTILGEEHLETLGVMSALATIYYNLGKLKDAEELMILVLERRRNILGKDHPTTQVATQDLAIISEALHKLQGEEVSNTF
ncbi:hypothetical protein C8R44DRAFT_858607 [Mycena epipterygia]|nr:hypothetical protein C8R44DRAFT_858607 [Mycena epipterygia]